MSNNVNTSINVVKSAAEPELLMLRMEIKAIRDRVVMDLDAALAKIDAALPPVDPERYKPRTTDEYRAMYGMRPRKREWRRTRNG
ncbi:MAG: hypothetical protein MUC33_01215 [Desulfobacterales bacterium]|jgi:hypothetical protein|nr:hypothetical protein [Desulfobacterales bacterium]MCU0601262.1 hypothetical protein [Desulfobacterales bacterium]